MSLLALNLDEAVESKPVKAGKYDLECVTMEEKDSKSGKPQIVLSVAIIGHIDAPNVTHYISLPAPGDDEGKVKFKVLLLKRTAALFGVKWSANGVETEEFIGAKCSAELELTEPDDSGNIYNRIKVPRLKDEPNQGGGNVPKPPKR